MKDEKNIINILNARIPVQEKTAQFLEENDNADLQFNGSQRGGQEPSDRRSNSKEAAEVSAVPILTDESDYIKTTLKDFLWYHGQLLEEQVPALLKWNNSFLVRYAYSKNNQPSLCLSVRDTKDKILHYALKLDKGGGWKCSKLLRTISVSNADKCFLHIYALIDYWSLSTVNPVTPIPRSKQIIYHEDVISEQRIGVGAFGEVWRGAVSIENRLKDCAIKTIKEESPTQTRALLQEAIITSVFSHACVIGYFGVCTLYNPPLLIMEYAVGGTVKAYLQETKDVTMETMYGFLLDISRGMNHLQSRKILHRDLAARNCLIGTRLTVKISDFGLAVKGPEVRVKQLKAAPIRWLSPETLTTGLFNEKTDVWAYGVTMWEVFTKCANVPLHPKTIKEAMDEIKAVEHPHKVPKSVTCSPKMLSLQQSCTMKKADARPTFRGIKMTVLRELDRCKAGFKEPGSKQGAQKSESNRKSARKSDSARKITPQHSDSPRKAGPAQKSDSARKLASTPGKSWIKSLRKKKKQPSSAAKCEESSNNSKMEMQKSSSNQ